jgi:hypothetical protein
MSTAINHCLHSVKCSIKNHPVGTGNVKATIASFDDIELRLSHLEAAVVRFDESALTATDGYRKSAARAKSFLSKNPMVAKIRARRLSA